jgi:hypothetical protein
MQNRVDVMVFDGNNKEEMTDDCGWAKSWRETLKLL